MNRKFRFKRHESLVCNVAVALGLEPSYFRRVFHILADKSHIQAVEKPSRSQENHCMAGQQDVK